MTNRFYKDRRLTARERFDVRTMQYFYPRRSGFKARVRSNDKAKMADLSSYGIRPKRRTPGFQKLAWGKTYRDLQVTQWSNDIRDGLITKAEIYDSLPDWLLPWIEPKLQYVPYDVDGLSTKMWITLYHQGR